ncbi:class I SAM-dependent methyltransferase [Limibaculum sp. FT325]|uniref:class I SAM-dependent methyltransferase n=1 Tax=Thermohalobaculum sediminis TaxID=2939436 RepID=UPI0020BF56AD|nr:class I SAM-dependent methyltransferase [Limibaculum sediminis]MCL5777444.1 class I SAM-dependent methyltransferase [Limibaculum sediminis]
METRCSICGHDQFGQRKVLWDALVNEWQLSPREREYVDRQQGMHCLSCGANLRGMALALAVQDAIGKDAPIAQLVKDPAVAALRVLDMNVTSISSSFRGLPNYVDARYPDVDMHSLPYPDGTFDIVVHSDTLEHVPNFVHALGECRRVLKPTGSLCYTVPIIVDRLTRSRAGLPPSYHGKAEGLRDDYLVVTEFGADAWRYPFEAGFGSVRFHTLRFPDAIAITASQSGVGIAGSSSGRAA